MIEPGPVLDRTDPPRRVLTAVEFDVLWERLGLGPTPVVLRLESPGRTHAERRAILTAGWQAMRDRGLAGPDGPEPELTRLLHVLARPAVQLELRGRWGGRTVRAMAAGYPGAGALAVRQDATVAITPYNSLSSGLLGTLPPAGPGPGRSCAVPDGALSAALTAPVDQRRAVLVAQHVPPDDAALLTRMLDEVESSAQLVALATDRWGVLRRSGGVLAVLDGPRGRYLLTRTTAEDGVGWTTVAPTDDRRLRVRLAELFAAADPAAAKA